jgi:hypothetical protein
MQSKEGNCVGKNAKKKMKDEAHRKEKKMMTIKRGREEPNEKLIWGYTDSLLHLTRSTDDVFYCSKICERFCCANEHLEVVTTLCLLKRPRFSAVWCVWKGEREDSSSVVLVATDFNIRGCTVYYNGCTSQRLYSVFLHASSYSWPI